MTWVCQSRFADCILLVQFNKIFCPLVPEIGIAFKGSINLKTDAMDGVLFHQETQNVFCDVCR